MIFQQFNIGNRLRIGFLLIIITFVTLSIYEQSRITMLSRQIENIYKHPLTVSNAVLRININLIKMQRSLQDVSEQRNRNRIREEIKIIKDLEDNILNDFKIIQNRFLGEKSKVEKSFNAFLDWKKIRDRLIQELLTGKQNSSVSLLSEKSARYIIRVEKAIETLGIFAQHKADEFLYQSKRIHDVSRISYIYITIFVLIIGIYLSISISNSITNPLRILEEGIAKFGRGDLNSKLVVDTNDEIGALSKAFDKMANDLKSVIASRDELNREIINRIQAEESLQLFEHIVSSTHDLLAFIDRNYIYQAVNDSYVHAFHKSKDEIIGKHVEEVIGRDHFQKTTKHKLNECFNNQVIRYQSWITFPDEQKRFLDITYYPYLDNYKRIQGVVVSSRDITKDKISEDKIKASLVEKETLLKEIHHRVKNNMAIISSLLELQSYYYLDNKELQNILKDSTQRIRTMSLIHNKLYLSENIAYISFKEYVVTLVDELIELYRLEKSSVKTEYQIEDIHLTIDTLIPCGLIINELVTNALKYAFPDVENPIITITLEKLDKERYVLKIHDNGIGMPKSISFSEETTFGLTIVRQLSKQISGSIEMLRNNGTEFHITFKPETMLGKDKINNED